MDTNFQKVNKPSEDAFFWSKLGIGVADGVGGWHAFGIDPSSFSNQFMKTCKDILKEKYAILQERIDETEYFNLEQTNTNFNEAPQNDSDIKIREIGEDFGSPSRSNKLKRTRSSFNLNDKILNQADQENSKNIDVSTPQLKPIKRIHAKNNDHLIGIEPRLIMKEAYKAVDAFGSWTAWISVLQEKMLKIANLGDSKCILVRYSINEKKSHVLLQTNEQQHNFNAPYQMAKVPKYLVNSKTGEKCNREETKFWRDKPEDSILYQMKVEEGDIVLWGTDGLFDNIFTDEILKIIDIFMFDYYTSHSESSSESVHTKSSSPESANRQDIFLTKRNAKRLAKELVKEAHRKSKSSNSITPFGQKFNSQNVKKDREIVKWKGGKPDDIWAVIGFVVKPNSLLN